MHRYSRPPLALLISLSLVVLNHPATLSAAEDDAFAKAFSFARVDLAATAVFVGDREAPATELHETPATAEQIRHILGLPSGRWGFGWPGYNGYRVKDHPLYESPVVFYRIAFATPVAIGATHITWRSDRPQTGKVRFFFLKPDATYPGTPGDEANWEELVAPAGQSGPFRTFPPNIQTRAVLVRHDAEQASSMERWSFFRKRLFDLRHGAIGQGERAPGASSGMNLARGKAWVNAWPKDDNDPVDRHPISDIEPSWVILSWDKPQTLTGITVRGNVEKAQPFILREKYTGNPILQPKKAWKAVARPAEAAWIPFPPVATRAIKVSILKVSGESHRIPGKEQIATVTELRAYTDLGTAAPPALTVHASDEPPFVIEYSLAREGTACVAVDDEAGHRTQNLIAQVPRQAGTHRLHWDLKDVDGTYVQPGTYRWKAVVGPAPELRYETSLYPNTAVNAPQNSAWLNGHAGSGGWLADHSGNSCITAHGESMFIGAGCAESGVALIETDLDGSKKWGRHNFMAWTGPQMLASDGTDLYAGVHKTDADHIWRVDETRETHKYLTIASTRLRHNGLRSMAIRDGKLYLALVSPRRNWLVNAATGAEVDMAHVIPLPPAEAKGGKEEDRPDPRADLLRLLRLGGYVAGHPHKDGAIYLTSERGPSRKQHIVVPFKTPLPLGSLVYSAERQVDYAIRFSVLKPGAPYPPARNDESQWRSIADPGKDRWNVLALPEKTVTRALRITFVKGGEDELLDAMEGMGNEDDGLRLGGDSTGPSGPAWAGRLEGLKILRRRFASLQEGMQVRVNSGTVDKRGWWDAKREKPLSPQAPGIYLMEWAEPQAVRGLAIREIDGAETRIDVYTGPAGGEIPLEGDPGWEEVATYKQKLRNHYQPTPSRNIHARYLDGYVDFGRTRSTRAVRLRVVKQWTQKEGRPTGIREDLGGTDLDPKRCRIWGVLPVRHLGGEVPEDPLTTGRIEVRDLETKELLQEVPLAVSRPLRFTPGGELLARQQNRIVKVDLTAATTTPLVTDLKQAGPFAVDAAGTLYAFDAARDVRVVRVYDATGTPQGTIGTPGGWRPGPWDPTRLGQVVDMATDTRGQLWLVERDKDPKRVVLWDTDGTFKTEFLGNTGYGGGGILDRYDKTRLRYGRMEFEIDWQSGKSRLRNLNFLQTCATGGHGIADLFPIAHGGHKYLVSGVSHPSMAGGIVFIFRKEEDTARFVGAVGQGGSFAPLQQPEFRPHLKGRVSQAYDIQYVDRNGDGQPQPEEVQLTYAGNQERHERFRVYGVDFDMGINTARRSRLEVETVLPNGTPVFAERPVPGLRNLPWDVHYFRKLRNGNYFAKISKGRSQGYNAAITPAGEILWRYPYDHEGVCSLWIAPWKPGWVTHQFLLIGNERVPGELEEVFVMNSNCGQWNLWTTDGLLAGQVFLHKHNRDARVLSFPEHERGMRWADLTMGQEHFSGSFTKTESDGKTYVVCGHNHISIAEVKGWEHYKRSAGTFTVTREDLQAARQWELERAAREVYVRAPKIAIHRGNLETVRKAPTAWLGNGEGHDRTGFAAAYDEENLYVAYHVYHQGPLQNTGSDWHLYFKSGAAVDLYLATDPAADPERDTPAPGDMRLLMTMAKEKPEVVLYAPTCPGAGEDEAWEVYTPAGGRSAFDRVKRLPAVKFYHEVLKDRGNVQGYRAMAIIPLKEIGLTAKPGRSIRLDWGILVSDAGNEVRRRRYWANTTNTGTADAPMESRLHPHLWGTAVFAGEKQDYADKLGGLGEDGFAGDDDVAEEELLDELEGL